ncbi:MAG: hypothetical protein LBE91_10510 [Tannerella sp.]|jgi:hypothetical protein|nr:hypothetical protein [Tannerella sp.]
MPELHLFNPGHEMEILYSKSHYTPPYTVQKMSADLEMLPIWYAGAGTFTLVRNNRATQFIASLPKTFRNNLSSPMILSLMMKELYKRKKDGIKPNLPHLEAVCWGISPRSISVFHDLQQAGMEIDIPAWSEELLELTRRQISAEALKKLLEIFPIAPAPKIPQFFPDIEGIEGYLKEHNPPYVIKTPFSSSGRGLYWLNENALDARATSWLSGALKKQLSVGIEPALNKVFDFATEFYSDGAGEISYAGLSIFETQQGQFIGCMLGSQESLLKRLNEYISTEDYSFLVEQVRTVLKEIVGTKYKGYMGVDMMIYQTEDKNYAVHPFVELNLRYTIGMAAMRFSQQFVHPASQGMLRIVYYVYDAYKEHQRMAEASPIMISSGKIRSGYYSLCPVSKDTHYLAIIDVFESY